MGAELGRDAGDADQPGAGYASADQRWACLPGGEPDEKGAYFGPRFQSATAAEWAALAKGDGLAPDDPRAIIVRRDLPDGQVWGTSSISMVAIDGAELRYCFGVPDGELAPVSTEGPRETSSSSTGASRRNSSK